MTAAVLNAGGAGMLGVDVLSAEAMRAKVRETHAGRPERTNDEQYLGIRLRITHIGQPAKWNLSNDSHSNLASAL